MTDHLTAQLTKSRLIQPDNDLAPSVAPDVSLWSRSPQLILDRRFRRTGPRGGWRLMRNASESSTFVAVTLALFVFLSAISMMTAAQQPGYVEAHIRSAPFFTQQVQLDAGSLKPDEAYGDFAVADHSTFARFDYTAFRDAMRIGRKTSHARHFDARGPPARA